MKRFVLVLSLVYFAVVQIFAGNKLKRETIKVTPSVCYASGKTEKGFIPPPIEFMLKSGAAKKSDIIVKYSLFPDNAKAAFEYAVGIWESVIQSDVPIYIEASWRTIYDKDNNKNTILGQASPTDFVSNFENAPRKDRYYPISVAEKIAGTDINPISYPDIQAIFNKEINWYFGTDGNTPGQLYDFVTVVLHEIGHGLGFYGFFQVSGTSGLYKYNNVQGKASSFDFLVQDLNGKNLVNPKDYSNPSAELYNAFISNSLYINSPVAISGNQGILPQLFAPVKWSDGSSIYHLNDETFPGNSENSLMTHAIGKGEAVHDPGPIAKGILEDIGWDQILIKPEKPKDLEVSNPIVFNAKIESTYRLDSSSVYLYFSKNLGEKRFDSIPMTFNRMGVFTATLTPTIDKGNIYYFVKATDVKKRTSYFPSEAPNEVDTINIGPDNKPPVIIHSPIPYFVMQENKIEINTLANDNLGVDTVLVEYSLNGEKQPSFGLPNTGNNRFTGSFNLDVSKLKDGDEISYQIKAVDASSAKNTVSFPKDSVLSFKIEKIFDPIGSYFNDFNYQTPDFVLYDFDVYTEKNFTNGALHSPHPYHSPEKDNANFNFTTFLKYPVVLNTKATMSFDEIVLVEPGEVLSVFGDDDFYDYVIVEGSKDKGLTWLPVADGYDSGANSTWITNYNKGISQNNSNTAGIPEWYVNRQIDLLKNKNFKAGDTLLIRFRLFSDPYAHGWGWAIDNLRIQQPVSSTDIKLSPGNILVYPNPFNENFTVSVFTEKQVESVLIEVFTVYGQKIVTIQNKNLLGETKQNFDLKDFPVGMYLVNVSENGNTIFSKKIIKN